MDKDADPPEKQPPERDTVFYYSRARRLERASETVRAMNEDAPPSRPSLFKPLVATKAHRLLLGSIIFIVIAFVIISFLASPDDRSKTLGGNTIALSALRFQGTTYLVIKKSMAEKDGAYTGTVDLAVSAALSPEDEKKGAEAPISTHRIFFSLEPEEEYRLSLPFEASRLIILMQGGEEMIRLSVQVE